MRATQGGLGGVLQEIIPQTKGDLPFPNGQSLRMRSRHFAPWVNCYIIIISEIFVLKEACDGRRRLC